MGRVSLKICREASAGKMGIFGFRLSRRSQTQAGPSGLGFEAPGQIVYKLGVMKKLFLLSACMALLTGCATWKEQPFTFVQMCDPQLGMGGYEADVARFKQAVKQINALKPDF